jgi:hypothetical protein
VADGGCAMTETQQRFLRAIAERVPKEQVVEVHLFPAIRQGGVETGVAVVAERPPAPPADASAANGEHAEERAAVGLIDPEFAPALAADSPEKEAFEAQRNHAEAAIEAGEPLDDEAAPEREDSSQQALEHQAPARLTVHTARYRLTLKGVDRGKWEVDVVAEADAPLAAVDAVVRGVQRRAGEGAEPDRLTADAFLDALEAPVATLDR